MASIRAVSSFRLLHQTFADNVFRMFKTTVYLVVCCMLMTGCNSGPELIPMSGQVKIDGKPLEMGAVVVWIQNYRPSYGPIGKDGRFSLMTHKPGDGCPKGEHRVTITSEMSTKGD